MNRDESIPKKILVVDDDAEVRARMTEALESEGWDVATCSDGSSVDSAARSFNPTVVLLDLRMPKKDGSEVLAELKKSHPWTRVVILTGHGDEEDAISCLNHEAFRYLRKPVSLADLFDSCEKARLNVPPVLWAFNSWFRSLPDGKKVVFNTASGRVITAEQLMEEIRGQTEIGQEFVQKVLSLASELVLKRLK